MKVIFFVKKVNILKRFFLKEERNLIFIHIIKWYMKELEFIMNEIWNLPESIFVLSEKKK